MSQAIPGTGAPAEAAAPVAVDGHDPFLTRPAHENHFVQFYDDEASLCRSVTQFLAAGVALSEPVVVIATAEHREAFARGLETQRIDVAAALASGQLTMLDARETLAELMVGGMPDPLRFLGTIEPVMKRAAAGRIGAPVRAYGEMVDLLCMDGQPEAAVRLEKLWNDLAEAHSFSLFCAYAMRRLHDGAAGQTYREICDAHTDLLNGTHHQVGDLLQHQVRARATSVARQRDAESFRLLVDSVQDYAIFMLDPQGFVSSWNVGARNIKGYTADEIIGKHFSSFYPEADNLAGKWQRELEIATEFGRFEEEGIRLRKDGSPFWASVVITALRDATGALVGFAKVTRDLTERVAAEQQRIALAQAEEANRVKDEFLAMLSHELRTPLTAILGWTAVLLPRAKDDPQLEKGLSTIKRNAQTQARLIEDMLDVSRIVLGKLRLEVKPADLSAVVREALEVVRPAADAKNVELRFERFDEPVLLVGDQTRLQQVVWNLLSNAVKFTDSGGSVFVRLEQEGSSIRLWIRDTGRGIDTAFLPHVFERFRQADSTSTRSSGGLGLGLAIVRHLVELHGGTVGVESEGKEKGATFCISLPVRAVAAAPESLPEVAVASGPSSSLTGIRVLVVDDEVDARELLHGLLSHRGAEVEMAASAEEALGLFARYRPDVIVSDIGMPVEDGYHLMRGVRALSPELGGRTAAIALTAYTSPQDRRRALEAGFTSHMAKPVDPDELIGTIRSLAAVAGAPRPRR